MKTMIYLKISHGGITMIKIFTMQWEQSIRLTIVKEINYSIAMA